MSSIDHPKHYGGDVKYEAIKLIVDWRLGFCGGNALKYVIRAPSKGRPQEDLAKAIWYLEYARTIGEPAGRWFKRTKLGVDDAVEFWGLQAPYDDALRYISVGEWHSARWCLLAAAEVGLVQT